MIHLKDIKPRVAQIGVGDRLEGRFKFRIRRPDGRVRETHWMPNLITNQGLDNFGFGGTNGTTIGGWLGQCYVGTGNSVPAYTDTALDTELTYTGISDRNSGVAPPATDPYYTYQRTEYTFAQGAATGIIAEIGVGPYNAGLSTRALVVDQVGDPATVPVLADEELTVVYEIRSYYTNVSVQDSQITIDSILYNTKRLPGVIGSSLGPEYNRGAGLNDILTYKDATVNIGVDAFDSPNDVMESIDSTIGAYSSGFHYRDSQVIVRKTQAYFGAYGITAIMMRGYLTQWQMSFTQVSAPTLGIPHGTSDDLYLTCRHSWARYEP